jgi:apolipoprotein N-acyltransferase
MFENAVMVADVHFISARTIYSRIGDLVGWLSVVLVAAALLATRRPRLQ